MKDRGVIMDASTGVGCRVRRRLRCPFWGEEKGLTVGIRDEVAQAMRGSVLKEGPDLLPVRLVI